MCVCLFIFVYFTVSFLKEKKKEGKKSKQINSLLFLDEKVARILPLDLVDEQLQGESSAYF